MSGDPGAMDIKAVRKGLVNDGGKASDGVRLLGSKCNSCGEVSIGTNSGCLNCGGDDIESIELSPKGKLWTYTIIRHKPPGEYLGPDPFEPFAIGLVELEDGVRVMSPLQGDISKFAVGEELHLVPWYLQAADGAIYRAFRYAQAAS